MEAIAMITFLNLCSMKENSASEKRISYLQYLI